MQSTVWNNMALSRLMQGTAQFGMPYGVANRQGQPSYAEVLRILAVAFEGGVNCFDTAAAYGCSEEFLGRALHELKISEQVTVVTKVRPLADLDDADAKAVASAIEQSVESSRRRLQLDCLPIVLFHREADAIHLPQLQDLQRRGWLSYAGVSVGHQPGPAKTILAADRIAALQIPGNIVDRRHLDSGLIKLAQDRGVAIFLRSVFLQGLLVMPASQIPESLRPIIPARRRYEDLASEAGISFGDLAARFLLSHPGVTCVIAGCETEDQMRHNIRLFSSGPLPADLLAAVRAATCELPESVITPGLWPANG